MRKTIKGRVNGPVLETDTGYVYTLFGIVEEFDGKLVLITVEEYEKDNVLR